MLDLETKADLQQIVDDGLEESFTLDYKGLGRPPLPTLKRYPRRFEHSFKSKGDCSAHTRVA